jgi:hypothetical protein
LGVIDSLSAGYRFLGRRIDLLLVPILLDLLLWLGPRLDIGSLFRQAAALYTDAAATEGMPTDMATLSGQMSEMLTTMGENTNLLSVLASSSLLHVPSLMAAIGPTSQQAVIEIAHPLAVIAFFLGLGLLSLLVGVVYLNQLAQALPLGSGPKPTDRSQFVNNVLRHWLMVLLYVLTLAVGMVAVSVPVGLLSSLFMFVSPAIASLLLLLVSSAFFALFFYLYFVTVAVVLDNLPVHRAIVASLRLVRRNFWATLGFVTLYNLIAIGFALLLAGLVGSSPVGTALGILVNAYIGSGLTLGLLVFYRTRILKQEERAHFMGAA